MKNSECPDQTAWMRLRCPRIPEHLFSHLTKSKDNVLYMDITTRGSCLQPAHTFIIMIIKLKVIIIMIRRLLLLLEIIIFVCVFEIKEKKSEV